MFVDLHLLVDQAVCDGLLTSCAVLLCRHAVHATHSDDNVARHRVDAPLCVALLSAGCQTMPLAVGCAVMAFCAHKPEQPGRNCS